VVKEAEAQDDSGSAGSRAESPFSESDLGTSETGSGSPRRDTTARRSPLLKSRPAEKGERKNEKSAKLERRKSMFAMLTSLLPTLTTSSPADPNGSGSQQQQPHRKHIFNQQQQQVPGGYWQPVYLVNSPSLAGAPVAHGWPATSVIPPAPLQPPPPPPKLPYAHSRNVSLPNPATMLRKDPKMAATSSTPRMPVLTATQPSPPRQPSHQRGRSASPSPRSTTGKLQPNPGRLQPRHPSASPNPRGRSSSAQPPIARPPADEAPRAASNPANAVPRSSASSDGESPGPKSKRRSWLPGGRSRSGSNDMDVNTRPGAWIITPGGQADYNASILANGEKVSYCRT
jgi:hypothetical protein